MISRTTLDETAHIAPDVPGVRRITAGDLRTALTRGVQDFREKPSHVVFLTIIYPIIALFLSRLVFGYEILPLLFPLAAGFALLGPVAALGLYELSRRREMGLDISWSHAVGVTKTPAIGAVVRLGLVLLALFVAWLFAAMAIHSMTLGTVPASVGDFATRLFTTAEGWSLIVAGNGAGLIFAVVVLSISVVSFPMLVDRDVSAGTAVRTSLKAVAANPVPMALWGLIVAGGLVLGSLPLFVGLAVVLPILGHATWHLYRAVVER